jgi:hypothetical protein
VKGAVPPGGGGVLLLLPVARCRQKPPHGNTCKFLRYGEGVMYKVIGDKKITIFSLSVDIYAGRIIRFVHFTALTDNSIELPSDVIFPLIQYRERKPGFTFPYVFFNKSRNNLHNNVFGYIVEIVDSKKVLAGYSFEKEPVVQDPLL